MKMEQDGETAKTEDEIERLILAVEKKVANDYIVMYNTVKGLHG